MYLYIYLYVFQAVNGFKVLSVALEDYTKTKSLLCSGAISVS